MSSCHGGAAATAAASGWSRSSRHRTAALLRAPVAAPASAVRRPSSSSSSRGGAAPAADPWRVLGVDRAATADEIKRAYRVLALRHHPDRSLGVDRATAAAAFRRIGTAYEALRKGGGAGGVGGRGSRSDAEQDAFLRQRLAELMRRQRDARGDGEMGCGGGGAEFAEHRHHTTEVTRNAEGTGGVARTATTFRRAGPPGETTHTREFVHEAEVDRNGEYQSGWHRQDGGWQTGPVTRVALERCPNGTPEGIGNDAAAEGTPPLPPTGAAPNAAPTRGQSRSWWRGWVPFAATAAAAAAYLQYGG